MEPFTNLIELEERAKPLLPISVFGYYASGSECEVSVRENKAALARWRLLPRVLRDVSTVDTSCELFGSRLSFPVMIAPMAMQRLCCPDGELAVARAAGEVGTTMVVSTMATASLEEVARARDERGTPPAGGGDLWFQMYVLTRRDVSAAMAQRAEQLGYKALVVTVDAPRLGKRDDNVRNAFSLPPHLRLKNLEMIDELAATTPEDNSVDGAKEGSYPFEHRFGAMIDPGLVWEDLSWLRTVTRLPILVKGILSPDDAVRAVDAGVDGIVVSNHGGRQLDCTPAPVDVLPHVARAVRGRVPLLVDGGIRRGTDVVKCLALGADAVLVGRPVLWALALGGQAGVAQALRLLREEVELAMALLGCRTLGEVTKEYVIPPPEGELRLPPGRAGV